jgi:hypothetical protein
MGRWNRVPLANRAMRAIAQLWIALLFAPQLLGQALPPSSIQLPTNEEIRKSNQAMVSIWNYCSTVAAYSNSHQPRLFARTAKSNETGVWDEFSSKLEWERAGKPKPLALAWYKENKVIRAVFSFTNNSHGDDRYADYCYRADGHLAKLRSEASNGAVCDDAYFRCQLTLPREWFYLPSGKIVNLIYDDQRLLKSEKTNLSLSSKPFEYLTIWDLPFAGSLFVQTK